MGQISELYEFIGVPLPRPPLSPSLPLQFHIPNPTTANYVRTVQLPLDIASLENVTKMVASNDGNYVFAMTPSRVSTL